MPEPRLSLRPTRLVAAMALMVVVSIAASVLLNVLVPHAVGDTDYAGLQRATALKSTAATLLGAIAGAYVARRRFLWAALALWAMQWLAIVQLLLRLSAPRTAWLQVVQSNALAIVGTLLATTFGVWIGQRVYARRAAMGPTAAL